MPHLIVNATGTRAALDEDALATALQGLAPGVPVIVMIHGFRFLPGDPRHCPHRHILSPAPDTGGDRVISWPRHLGAGRGPRAPLCIALGWPARGTIWQAWRAAAGAALALEALVRAIGRHHSGPVQVIAHSLGARVALGALTRLPRGSIGRMILLSGAALRGEARAALDSPAGRSAEVVNVTGRENALFDTMLEAALAAPGQSIGRGLGAPHPRWLDLWSTRPAVRAGLARLGHRIAPQRRRVCHWSGYLRPGLFPLYRRLLTDAGSLPLPLLRTAVAPDASAAAPFTQVCDGLAASVLRLCGKSFAPARTRPLSRRAKPPTCGA